MTKPETDSKQVISTMNKSWENNLYKALREYEEYRNKEHEIKEKKIQKNLDALYEKSKELGESIPDELLVIVAGDLTIGSEFVKKYEKWLK